MVYIRFIVHYIDRSTGLEKGMLSVAYDALGHKGIPEYQARAIQTHLDWLKDNLPIPEKFSRTRNDFHKNTRGLSWLKPTSHEALQHLRALATILEDYGIPVSVVTTDKPGYLIYEDEWQIVAEPFGKE